MSCCVIERACVLLLLLRSEPFSHLSVYGWFKNVTFVCVLSHFKLIMQ